MKAVGIIVVKENSNRFPGKNYFNIKGKPLFMHSIDLLLNCDVVDDVYVATDSVIINSQCKNVVPVIWRYANIAFDDQPYIDVLRYAYQNLSRRYDAIVTVLGNSIGHDKNAIENGLLMLENDEKIKEIRSFDKDGNQSGIFIFREEIVLSAHSTLSHMAAIKSNGKEIHYKEELEK